MRKNIKVPFKCFVIQIKVRIFNFFYSDLNIKYFINRYKCLKNKQPLDHGWNPPTEKEKENFRRHSLGCP